jgi:hypothetical protein
MLEKPCIKWNFVWWLAFNTFSANTGGLQNQTLIMSHCWNYILKVSEQISMFTHINKYVTMCLEWTHGPLSNNSASSGCQWSRDSQGGANAEYSDVAGDKNLGFGMCSNLIPRELWKYHKQPQAHTTVKFLWALQWISCVRISLDMMVKTKVLPLPVSDPGQSNLLYEATQSPSHR